MQLLVFKHLTKRFCRKTGREKVTWLRENCWGLKCKWTRENWDQKLVFVTSAEEISAVGTASSLWTRQEDNTEPQVWTRTHLRHKEIPHSAKYSTKSTNDEFSARSLSHTELSFSVPAAPVSWLNLWTTFQSERDETTVGNITKLLWYQSEVVLHLSLHFTILVWYFTIFCHITEKSESVKQPTDEWILFSRRFRCNSFNVSLQLH